MFRKLLFIVFLVLPITTWGHSPLISVSPKDKAILDETPSEIVMVFKSPIELIKLEIRKSEQDISSKSFFSRLFADNDSNLVSLSKDFLMQMGKRQTIPVPKLTTGLYEVTWRAIGKDGHIIKGRFNFTISDE